jgi:hypothetical protein
MSNHGETERFIISLFVDEKEFYFEKVKYKIDIIGKPKPSKGECKTDVYILARNTLTNEKREFKISIKQTDADFLENKISLARAKEILGSDAQKVIIKSVLSVKKSFEEEYLVYFDKHKRTESNCIKIGWRFEFINKPGGERSGLMVLSESQKIDLYSGSNLSELKKDSMVQQSVIKNSGVANFILEVDSTSEDLNYYIDRLEPIKNFAIKQEIYFACKAVNYRAAPDKWDGPRPLSVYVQWSLNDGKISAELVMNNPLGVKANEIGLKIQQILKELSISVNNFKDLEKHLSDEINVFRLD